MPCKKKAIQGAQNCFVDLPFSVYQSFRDHPHTTSDFLEGGGVRPNPMKSDDKGGRGLAKSDVGKIQHEKMFFEIYLLISHRSTISNLSTYLIFGSKKRWKMITTY